MRRASRPAIWVTTTWPTGAVGVITSELRSLSCEALSRSAEKNLPGR